MESSIRPCQLRWLRLEEAFIGERAMVVERPRATESLPPALLRSDPILGCPTLEECAGLITLREDPSLPQDHSALTSPRLSRPKTFIGDLLLRRQYGVNTLRRVGTLANCPLLLPLTLVVRVLPPSKRMTSTSKIRRIRKRSWRRTKRQKGNARLKSANALSASSVAITLGC